VPAALIEALRRSRVVLPVEPRCSRRIRCQLGSSSVQKRSSATSVSVTTPMVDGPRSQPTSPLPTSLRSSGWPPSTSWA
jgi:hypothetical protein